MADTAAAEVTGEIRERFDEVLTPEALAFVADLQKRFGPRRKELLDARRARREEAARTGRLDFLDETKDVRDDTSWHVAPLAELQDRRVEITGPTERKMLINALNSGAKVFMADFEDASTPTWVNKVQGQINLTDAIERRIDYTAQDTGKEYKLKEQVATLMPRPRGWHLPEKHVLVDGEPMSGGLFDFGMFFFHNVKRLLDKGGRPYFYLPKMESHLEARLWNDVFVHAQQALDVPVGTIRATVLIETIPAAFQMDEILYELRDHSYGLNAGRWDYMFSMIKTFRDRGAEFLLPDRNSVTMTVPFMHAYTELLVQTCHKRGAFAMGGMAAFIPSKDPELNKVALDKVQADKAREAKAGFDGSWVAHPGLVETAMKEFDAVLGDKPNQIDKQRPDVHVSADDLLAANQTPGEKTSTGLRTNVDVGIRYIESWLRGNGAAAIHNLMEDAATAEISRSQVWQWVHNDVELDDTHEQVTAELVRQVADSVMGEIREEIGGEKFDSGRWKEARDVFEEVALSDDFVDFLTLPAYERID